MSKKILWLDLETTGLDPKECKILEIGAIVTDGDLKELGRFHYVIRQHAEDLKKMDAYCEKMHRESGLYEQVSLDGVSQRFAESIFINFIRARFGKDKPNLAGNSVHFDKSFLYEHMPSAHELLHHRIIDVSSFRLTLETVFGIKQASAPAAHRAIDDCLSSIEQYKEALCLLAGTKYAK